MIYIVLLFYLDPTSNCASRFKSALQSWTCQSVTCTMGTTTLGFNTSQKSQLLFTDTDSFCVAVEHPDVYGEIATFKDWFDFSEYPRDHPLFDESNRKRVGKFKDELNGLCMTRFIGLRPKLYSFEYLDLSGVVFGKNTAKGIQKAMKKRLTFDDYKQSVHCTRVKKVTMNSIRSDHHHIYTYHINKIGLSGFDDKRYILDNGISTLAHGHHRTIVNSL